MATLSPNYSCNLEPSEWQNATIQNLTSSLAAEGLYPAPTVKVFFSVDSIPLGPPKHIRAG